MADARTHSGQCLCGAITFEVHGPLREVINCHCERCRRFTGHHMAATSASLADLLLVDPGLRLAWHWPVPEAGDGFCGQCGSSLFWQSAREADRIWICAGSISPPTGLRTVQAWWVSHASDYCTRPDLPEYPEEPATHGDWTS